MIEIPDSHLELAHEMVGPLSTYLDCAPSGTLDKDRFMEFTAPVSVSIDILSGIQESHLHLDDDPPFKLCEKARITAHNSQADTGFTLVLRCFTGEVGTHIGRMQS